MMSWVRNFSSISPGFVAWFTIGVSLKNSMCVFNIKFGKNGCPGFFEYLLILWACSGSVRVGIFRCFTHAKCKGATPLTKITKPCTAHEHGTHASTLAPGPLLFLRVFLKLDLPISGSRSITGSGCLNYLCAVTKTTRESAKRGWWRATYKNCLAVASIRISTKFKNAPWWFHELAWRQMCQLQVKSSTLVTNKIFLRRQLTGDSMI